jgi:ubiquitin carboxyl-terminal hydrolase 10
MNSLQNLLAQPDSVHTVEDALSRILQPQALQVGQLNSSEASQQVQIEVLPSILALHLKRFLYDVAAGGTIKISKSIQFAPELDIPLSTTFSIVSCQG